MDRQETIALLEHSLQVRAGTVPPDGVLAEINGWDSMGIVAFVGEAFDRLDVELAVDDIQACTTVGDLVALVAAKVAS